jgi:hypothetical protein
VPAGKPRAWLAIGALCAATLAHADYKDNYALGPEGLQRWRLCEGARTDAAGVCRARRAGRAHSLVRPALGSVRAAILPGHGRVQAGRLRDGAGRNGTRPRTSRLSRRFPKSTARSSATPPPCEQKVVAKTEDKPKPQPTAPETPPAKTVGCRKSSAKPASPPPATPKPAEPAPEQVVPPAKRVDVAVAKPAPPVSHAAGRKIAAARQRAACAARGSVRQLSGRTLRQRSCA